MNDKLFIIGNGFDRAHGMPTSFDSHFRRFAEKREYNDFWKLYQSKEDDIWSDFENLLAHPDYNNLEQIFEGHQPDYLSDRESDRDDIILQAQVSGDLKGALYEFANYAEKTLINTERMPFFGRLLDVEGYYISFNYTHTLEEIYDIPKERVLHIHGEVGKGNLELGYPQGSYAPEKYHYDVRQKGRGPYATIEIEDHISDIEDYYIRTAYETLKEKCESFYKEPRIDLLKEFLNKNHCTSNEIVVYGHSCAIDFEYFKYLNTTYSNAEWTFYVKGDKQDEDVQDLIKKYSIDSTNIIKL